MKLTLLTVGKLKNDSIAALYADYFERAGRFFPIQSIEVKDCPVKGSLTITQSQEREGEELLKMIPSRAHVILLDERGKESTTQKWADLFQKWQNESQKEIIFVIGGAYGLSKALKEKFPEKLALSQMTLTHEMSRLLLIEQIYRVGTILKGMKYHH